MVLPEPFRRLGAWGRGREGIPRKPNNRATLQGLNHRSTVAYALYSQLRLGLQLDKVELGLKLALG